MSFTSQRQNDKLPSVASVATQRHTTTTTTNGVNMDFSYEVTLSPENEKKWQEMISDVNSKKAMLKIYELLLNSNRIADNQIIETAYLSHKEGRLDEHFEQFKKLHEASDFLKDYKF